MTWLRLSIMLFFAAIIAFFAVNNSGATTINLWPMPLEINTPVFLLIMVSIFGGYLIGSIRGFTKKIKSWRLIKQQASTIKALQNELSGLKVQRLARH